MTGTRKLAAVAAGMALVLIPATAIAQSSRVYDRSGDTRPAVDVTQLTVKHRNHRIEGTIRIPDLEPGKLAGTELLIRTKGKKKVYAASVLRNRKGKVVVTSLTWRRLNDPVEPKVLPCPGLKTKTWTKRTSVSVPKSCLTKTGPNRKIQAKARTIGAFDLEGAYFDDQTGFSPYLSRGH